ncbi:MAG: M23 family metallopeptidase [bacterium]|nr:M23 family metallopeptidase [bacterium]
MLGTIVRTSLVSARERQLHSLPRLNSHPYVLSTTGYETLAVVVDAAAVILLLSRLGRAVGKIASQALPAILLTVFTVLGMIFLKTDSPVSPSIAAQSKDLPKIEQFVSAVATNNFQKPLAGLVSQHYWWGHPGTDIRAPYSTKIRPIESGTVIETSFEAGGYGFQILVRHKDGFVSRYAHLSKILVKVGDKITKFKVIGTVGTSGDATGPHLHLELTRKGETLDAEKYLPNYQFSP